MLLKCLLIFGFILFVGAASIPKEIPVNVVYGEPEETQENSREKHHVRYLQNRNLNEKVQLSGRELKEVDLHLPAQDEPEKTDGKLFAKAKTVFLEKLTNFREQVEGLKLKSYQKKPTVQEWTQLNDKVQEIFKKYEGTGLRQNQGGFFQELTQATGQWFQSLGGGNNNNPSGQEDEQPANQGGIGQAWTNFQNSISQAFSNLTNNNSNNNNNDNQQSTTSNTVLGDTGVASTARPGFFVELVSSVFNNNNNQGNKPPGQEDTGVTQPPNIFQGAINNFINTFNPTTGKPAGAQGDTEAAPSTAAPGNQIIQNIGNAFNQVFGQSTKPPGTSGDNAAENKPPSFFENFGNAIQQVFNQNNQNQESTTASSQSATSPSGPIFIQQGLQQFQLPGQNGSNIIEQFQNAGQQNFGQNIGQQLGGGSGNNQIQQISQGLQNPQNFATQAQNIGQQFGGNLTSGSQNPGQQLTGAIQNPQNFASQAQNIGQQISGNIPGGQQNPAQNFANQAQNIGQQISGNITSGSQNPVQNFASQAQNIGQQLGGNQNSNEGDLDQDVNSQNSVTNLNINQIPVIGQQLGQNPQNPLQNIQQQFQQNNIVNQFQNSTNLIQNPVANNNNPLNLIDTQNQQVNINQLNQVIPTNSQSGDGLQSTLTNQFNNGVSQLNPQNGASTFLSGANNPLTAATGLIQPSNGGGEVKPVNEETKEKKGLIKNTKSTGEPEIMVANE